MVSGWFLLAAFVAGAVVGGAGVAIGLRARPGRSSGRAQTQSVETTPPEPAGAAQPTHGIDVQGALRDLEERYRGRTADEIDPPKRKHRQQRLNEEDRHG